MTDLVESLRRNLLQVLTTPFTLLNNVIEHTSVDDALNNGITCNSSLINDVHHRPYGVILK